jgi:alkyl hydroperoxide reductase subunit AhpF
LILLRDAQSRPKVLPREARSYNPCMSLLSAQDEQVLTKHLSAIDKPVSLLLFTQTIGGSESGPVTRQVLDEVARLNDKITIVEKNFVLDVDDRKTYGVDKSPAIVFLSDGQDTRMRMYGAPTGYEFVGLVEAILIAGTGNVDLEEETLKLLAPVSTPTHIQVFSTPT